MRAMASLGKFEWDAVKAASNLQKHGVSFAEAMECFLDPHGIESRMSNIPAASCSSVIRNGSAC